MQSKKNVKSEEECLEKRTTLEASDDPIGLKETCPFQDQGIIEGHCRTDCAWYSDDKCCIWDLIQALQGIRGSLEQLLKTR